VTLALTILATRAYGDPLRLLAANFEFPDAACHSFAAAWAACVARASGLLKLRSLTLRDHSEGIKMPLAKFRADTLKTVAVHNEQRNKTNTERQIHFLYTRQTY